MLVFPLRFPVHSSSVTYWRCHDLPRIHILLVAFMFRQKFIAYLFKTGWTVRIWETEADVTIATRRLQSVLYRRTSGQCMKTRTDLTGEPGEFCERLLQSQQNLATS